MAFKSDIEIARAATLKPITEIADKLGIPNDALIPFGHDKAKISSDFIEANGKKKDGKLILVTAVPCHRHRPAKVRRRRRSASATA